MQSINFLKQNKKKLPIPKNQLWWKGLKLEQIWPSSIIIHF